MFENESSAHTSWFYILNVFLKILNLNFLSLFFKINIIFLFLYYLNVLLKIIFKK